MRRFLRGAALCALGLPVLLLGLWLLIPAHDRPEPGELLAYLTDPDRVVNAPIAYELLGIAMGAPAAHELAERIRVPDGYAIGLFADGLPHVRFLHFAPSGHLLASQSMKGRVLRLEPDRDGDGRSDGVTVLLEDLVAPHGLLTLPGWLYVAERTAIVRIRLDPATGALSGPLENLVRLPDEAAHGLRPLELGPDGWIYTAVGAPCNVCTSADPIHATILRMRPEGGQPEIYATGLRNVVDLGWHPTTGELYATEVGRDFMGDDLPPDELNRIERGAFYGFPFLHGDGIPDPDLAPPDAASISEARSPAYAFPAHSTPLGLTFLASGEALVALHGSWNRSQKVGYEIVALRWDRDGIAVSAFASGFERDEDVVGRPVDVIEGPDGAIYVSDDYAGAIYRIARVAPAHALRPGETGRVDYRSRHRSP